MCYSSVRMVSETVKHMDLRAACIVPLCKGKGQKYERSKLKGTSLLSVVGKLLGAVLIKRVMAGTECAIRVEHCGFRQVRGCINQVF